MARPLRIEFPGAVYHVTSRGNRGEPIIVDEEDRRALLEVVGQALTRFDVHMLAYCLIHCRRANRGQASMALP